MNVKNPHTAETKHGNPKELLARLTTAEAKTAPYATD